MKTNIPSEFLNWFQHLPYEDAWLVLVMHFDRNTQQGSDQIAERHFQELSDEFYSELKDRWERWRATYTDEQRSALYEWFDKTSTDEMWQNAIEYYDRVSNGGKNPFAREHLKLRFGTLYPELLERWNEWCKTKELPDQ